MNLLKNVQLFQTVSKENLLLVQAVELVIPLNLDG